MKLGIIISTKIAETNWNAFRLANLALDQGDEVKVFLLGEGVEYETGNSDRFNIQEQVTKFLKSDRAQVMACGTCLTLRKQEESQSCPASTIRDLYRTVDESDKVLTF